MSTLTPEAILLPLDEVDGTIDDTVITVEDVD